MHQLKLLHVFLALMFALSAWADYKDLQTDEPTALERGTIEEVKESYKLDDMLDCEGGAKIAAWHKNSVAWFSKTGPSH